MEGKAGMTREASSPPKLVLISSGSTPQSLHLSLAAPPTPDQTLRSFAMARVKKRKLPGGINSVDILNGINSNRSRSRVPAPRTGVYEITSSPPERERPRRETQRKSHQTRSRRTETEVTQDVAQDRAQSEPREQDQLMNDASEQESEPEQNGTFEQPNNEDSGRVHEVRFPGFEEFDSSDDEQDEQEEQGEQEWQEEEGNLRIFGSDEAEDQPEDSNEPHEPEKSDEQGDPETGYRDEDDFETQDLVQETSGQVEPEQQYPENDDSSREENEGNEQEGEGNDDEGNQNETSHGVSRSRSSSVQVVIDSGSASTGRIAEGVDHDHRTNSTNDPHTIQPAIRERGQRRKRAVVLVRPTEPEPEPRRGDRRNGNPKPRREPSPSPPAPEYFNEMRTWLSQTVQHTKKGELWKDLFKRASELRKRNSDSMPSRFEDAHALLFSLRDLYRDIEDRSVANELPPFFTDKVAELCASSLEAIQLSLDFPSVPDDQHDPSLAGELILSFEEHVLPHTVLSIILALRTYILFGKPAKAPFLGVLQLVFDCCTYIDMLRPYYETNRNRQRSWKLGMCARDIKRELAKEKLLDLLPADFSETVDEDRRSERGPDERWTDEKEGEFADVWSEFETRQCQ